MEGEGPEERVGWWMRDPGSETIPVPGTPSAAPTLRRLVSPLLTSVGADAAGRGVCVLVDISKKYHLFIWWKRMRSGNGDGEGVS